MSKFRSKVSKFSQPSKPLWQKIQTSVITTMGLVPQMSVGLIYDDSKTAEIDNEPDLSDLYAYETFFGSDNPSVLIEEVKKTLDVVKELEVEVEAEVEEAQVEEAQVEEEQVEEAEVEVEEAEVEAEVEVEEKEVEEAEVEAEVEAEAEVEPEVEKVVPDATKRIRSILKKKSIIDVVMELQREALREKLVNLKKKNVV
jgi:hypothetical protein